MNFFENILIKGKVKININQLKLIGGKSRHESKRLLFLSNPINRSLLRQFRRLSKNFWDRNNNQNIQHKIRR